MPLEVAVVVQAGEAGVAQGWRRAALRTVAAAERTGPGAWEQEGVRSQGFGLRPPGGRAVAPRRGAGRPSRAFVGEPESSFPFCLGLWLWGQHSAGLTKESEVSPSPF